MLDNKNRRRSCLGHVEEQTAKLCPKVCVWVPGADEARRQQVKEKLTGQCEPGNGAPEETEVKYPWRRWKNHSYQESLASSSKSIFIYSLRNYLDSQRP